MSKNKLAGIVGVFSAILIAFITGEALGAKYALIREMQLYEEMLARNLPILSYCKINQCDEELQKILIQENDTAIQQYVLLERTYTNTLNRNVWYATWPIVFSLYSAPKSVTPSERLRGYYKKLGCGLNGVICQTTKPEPGLAK